MRRAAGFGALVVVVVGLALLLAFRLFGERSLLLILVGGVPPLPLLLALTTTALLAALLLRDRRALLLSVVVPVAILGLLTPASSSSSSSLSSSSLSSSSASASPSSSSRATLRVAAWNIAKGTYGLDGLVRGIRALDADVVCLSEAGSYDWLVDVDSKALPALLEGEWLLHGEREVRALVRRGVTVTSTTEQPLPPGPASRPLLLLTVEKQPGAAVVVGCLHLMPKLLFLKDAVDRGAARTGSWSEIAAAAWQQGQALRDVVAALPVPSPTSPSGTPVVLGGDFNNVAHGAIVGGLVDAGFVDVLRDSGVGPFTVTFSDALRGKRIDHLLVRGAAAASARVVDVDGSDHRPIVVDVVLDVGVDVVDLGGR